MSERLHSDGQALKSYCRTPDGKGGSWSADCPPTFGAKNMAP